MRDPRRLHALAQQMRRTQAEATSVEDLKQMVVLLAAEVEHLQREVDQARAIANRASRMGPYR